MFLLLGENNRCIFSEVKLENTWEKDISYYMFLQVQYIVQLMPRWLERNLIDSCIGRPGDCSWAFATNRQAL